MARGWKGNVLGLQRWEVECAHNARLDATEAVAHLMRQGKSFDEAKAVIVKRADAVYKHSRPALYEGYRRCVADVRFADMPKDIVRGVEDRFLSDIEKMRGRKAGKVERWFYRLTGMTF